MDIQTKFGVAKNITIEEYSCNGSYLLGFISRLEETGDYEMLGFDAPINDDPVWRFWVECGNGKDGSAETYNAELSDKDKQYIKGMYDELIGDKTNV